MAGLLLGNLVQVVIIQIPYYLPYIPIMVTEMAVDQNPVLLRAAPLLQTFVAGPLLQTLVADLCVEYCSLQGLVAEGFVAEHSCL